MSTDGQGTKRRKEIAENFNRLSRVHERYRQRDDRHTTDGRAIAYSEREFTFAKKRINEVFECHRSSVGVSATSKLFKTQCIASLLL